MRVVRCTVRTGSAAATALLAAALLAAASAAPPAAGTVREPAGRAAHGRQLWAVRYNGPAGRGDYATSVAVGPDGKMVFVTGRSEGSPSGFDYATVGYDAATGARRWVARYKGPGDSRDAAAAIAVSPDGRTVFVAGASGQDAATVAYSGHGYRAVGQAL